MYNTVASSGFGKAAPVPKLFDATVVETLKSRSNLKAERASQQFTIVLKWSLFFSVFM